MKVRNRLRSLRLVALLGFILLFGAGGTDPLMELIAEFRCEECEKDKSIGVSPVSLRVLAGPELKFVSAFSLSGDPADWTVRPTVITHRFFGQLNYTTSQDILSDSKDQPSVEIQIGIEELKASAAPVRGGEPKPDLFTVSATFEDGETARASFQVTPVMPRLIVPLSALRLGSGEHDVTFRLIGVANPERCHWEDDNSGVNMSLVSGLPADGEEATVKLKASCASRSNGVFRMNVECEGSPLKHQFVSITCP